MLNIFINIAHAITIDNPLGANTTVADVINRIAGYMYGVAAALSTIMVLIGAFQILTAAGDAVKYKKGKDTIVYTVIGLAIILLAGGVVSLVSGILGGGDSGRAPVERHFLPVGPAQGVDTVPLPTQPPTFMPPQNPLEQPPTTAI